MLVTLSVEAKGAASFFQVIVVEASGIPAAQSKAIASYAARGYDDIRFDEAESAFIEAKDVTLPRAFGVSDGIVAASERFWVLPPRSHWRLPVRARAGLIFLAWPVGGFTLFALDHLTGWPFAFMLPIWMIAIALASFTIRCERCGKNPHFPKRTDGLPRHLMSTPFIGPVCTFCNEPLDLEPAPTAMRTPVIETSTPKSPFPYR